MGCGASTANGPAAAAPAADAIVGDEKPAKTAEPTLDKEKPMDSRPHAPPAPAAAPAAAPPAAPEPSPPAPNLLGSQPPEKKAKLADEAVPPSGKSVSVSVVPRASNQDEVKVHLKPLDPDGAGPSAPAAAPAGPASAPAVRAAPSTEDTTGPNGERIVHFCHFNDVYDCDEGKNEPVGGAARFRTALKQYDRYQPLVIFGGDGFFPSLQSTVLKGKQMVPILNSLGITVACVGNHELDAGEAHVRGLMQDCDFPWLMANVLDAKTHKPLCGAGDKLIVEKNGVKIGFFSVVEQEWIETLATLEPEDIKYVDLFEDAARLSAELRSDGCELIVACTHSRMPNDYALMKRVLDIDLLLGGHDHHYEEGRVEPGGRIVLNSGSDFKQLSFVTVTMPPKGVEGRPLKQECVRVDVTKAIEPDPEMKAIVDDIAAQVGSKMDLVLGQISQDLDARFAKIRTEETNCSNLIGDVMRYYLRSDVAIINSGSIRADKIIPAGDFAMRDMMSLLPMLDETCAIEMTGAQLLEALENGVSQYPAYEGRFPCVAGVRFAFDPFKKSGERIVADSVRVLRFNHRGGAGIFGEAGEHDWEPLGLEASYKVATKAYLALGKDGYDSMKDCRMLVDPEQGIAIQMAIRNLFSTLDVLSALRNAKAQSADPNSNTLGALAAHAWKMKSVKHRSQSLAPDEAAEATHGGPGANGIVFDEETKRFVVNVKVEGRIVNLHPLH